MILHDTAPALSATARFDIEVQLTVYVHRHMSINREAGKQANWQPVDGTGAYLL